MNYVRRSLTAFFSLGSLAAKLQRVFAAQPAGSSINGGHNNLTDSKSVPVIKMESFSLNYELTGAGWAHAKVSVGSSTHETEVSYLTRDPLGLLAGVLIGLIWPEEGTIFVFNRPGQKPLNPEDLKTRSFIWEDEPGGWKWSLRPHGTGAVNVKLEQRAPQAGGEPLIDSICPLRDVASACAANIEALLVKHGIVGYQLDWTYGELPLAQYLLLKRWLQSPGYVAKATEGGTWKEDVTALRLLADSPRRPS